MVQLIFNGNHRQHNTEIAYKVFLEVSEIKKNML